MPAQAKLSNQLQTQRILTHQLFPWKTIPDFYEAEPKSKIAFNIFDSEKVRIVSEGSRVYNTCRGDTVYNFGQEFFVNNKEYDEDGEIYSYYEDNGEYDQYDSYQNEVKYCQAQSQLQVKLSLKTEFSLIFI